jgi:hypothetical protein
MPVDHYENFPVASLLLPRRLRRPVEAIYRFARGADDIADEGDASDAVRLQGLAEYRDELGRIERGEPPAGQDFAELAAIIAREWHLPVPVCATCSMRLRRMSSRSAMPITRNSSTTADVPPIRWAACCCIWSGGTAKKPAPLGLHLLRPATGQFLAGHRHRLAQAAHLSATWRP